MRPTGSLELEPGGSRTGATGATLVQLVQQLVQLVQGFGYGLPLLDTGYAPGLLTHFSTVFGTSFAKSWKMILRQ